MIAVLRKGLQLEDNLTAIEVVVIIAVLMLLVLLSVVIV